MSITKGQTVRLRVSGQRAFGVVETAPALHPGGPVVSVRLLPDFAHLVPTGWVDKGTDELTAVKVCACAHLAYRPIYGDHKGDLFTTGCDFSRMPSRTSKFLPGHDAKAKGFLIRAYSENSVMENGKGALENARELGDKIVMKVAEGIDKARKARAVRTRPTAKPEAAPVTREDLLTEAQRLQRKLGVTDAMMRSLARAITQWDGRIVGTPAGTEVAMQQRDLVRWGAVTDLGYAVMDHPTLAEEKPELAVCKDDLGAYAEHVFRWDEERSDRLCVRCGQADPDQ